MKGDEVNENFVKTRFSLSEFTFQKIKTKTPQSLKIVNTIVIDALDIVFNCTKRENSVYIYDLLWQ